MRKYGDRDKITTQCAPSIRLVSFRLDFRGMTSNANKEVSKTEFKLSSREPLILISASESIVGANVERANKTALHQHQQLLARICIDLKWKDKVDIVYSMAGTERV